MTRSLSRQLWILLSALVIDFYASVINHFRAIGIDNLPARGGTLIVANHTSAYDTIFMPCKIIVRFPQRMVWAPAKVELFRNRFLGSLIASWGAFPVRRGRDLGAFKRLLRLLRTEMVMLFPEGTRRPDGKIEKANRAVGKLIYDVRPKVIPAAFFGLRGWKVLGYGQRAHLVFGRAIDFSDLFALEDPKRAVQLINERIVDSIAGLLSSHQLEQE